MKRMVLIEWLDSHGTFGWSPDAGAMPSICWTVGFVLEEGNDYVRLAFGLSDLENVFCTIAIPRAAILKVEEVK